LVIKRNPRHITSLKNVFRPFQGQDAWRDSERSCMVSGSDKPADLNAILQELRQPPRSVLDMPRQIELCGQALAFISRQQDSALWGFLQVVLADSLAQNPQGPRAENLEQAIAHYNQALEVITRDAYPEVWAATQINLANAYGERIRGERAQNV